MKSLMVLNFSYLLCITHMSHFFIENEQEIWIVSFSPSLLEMFPVRSPRCYVEKKLNKLTCLRDVINTKIKIMNYLGHFGNSPKIFRNPPDNHKLLSFYGSDSKTQQHLLDFVQRKQSRNITIINYYA